MVFDMSNAIVPVMLGENKASVFLVQMRIHIHLKRDTNHSCINGMTTQQFKETIYSIHNKPASIQLHFSFPFRNIQKGTYLLHAMAKRPFISR